MSEYNGWKNYETWCVNLWINNDQGLYEYLCDEAKHLPMECLAMELKVQIENQAPTTLGMYADLLGHALESVDWYTIAEHLKEEN